MNIIKYVIPAVSLFFTVSIYAEEPVCSNSYGVSPAFNKAYYVGDYKGADSKLVATDYYRDFHCAEKFIEKYPNKFLTIFGSSRINGDNKNKHKEQSLYDVAANDILYKMTYEFSKQWAKKHGKKYPVLTGAGPGLMEAAAKGAVDGRKSTSIGYTTYYTDQAKCINDFEGSAECGASYVYWDNKIIDDGLIFTSVSARETAMILHSAAAVITPGGGGTNWEIFQMLEMLKSKQLNPIPVYFLGDRSHWKAYEKYINDMISRGTIKYKDKRQFVNFVTSTDELMRLLEADLSL